MVATRNGLAGLERRCGQVWEDRPTEMSTETDRVAQLSNAQGGCAPSEESYLTINEFAARSGRSASTVRRLIDAELIPIYQPAGKRSRIAIPASALRPTPRQRGGVAPTGRQDQPPILQPASTGNALMDAAAGPATVQRAVGGPSQAHAYSPQPPTRLPGPKPKWQQALLRHGAGDATGVRQ